MNHTSCGVNRSRRAKKSFGFDQLEDRCLLASSPNVLVVDFTTPGGVLPLQDGGFIPASSFADQFPSVSEAQRVVGKIEQRLDRLLNAVPNPPDLVIGGLFDKAPFDLGLSRLIYSQDQDARLTDVIYASGSNFTIAPNIVGLAFQAPVGSNLEHYGFAFTASLNFDFVNGSTKQAARNAAKQLFIVQVSNIIAHEYGHLVGLGHVNSLSSVMNSYVAGIQARFVDTTFEQTDLFNGNGGFCGAQNQYQELVDSMNGSQPVAPGSNHWRYRKGSPGGGGEPPKPPVSSPSCTIASLPVSAAQFTQTIQTVDGAASVS